MKIEATWSKAIPLEKGSAHGDKIYDVDLDLVPKEPGVYVFARRHGDKITPIYIGESVGLRGRITGHLKSLPLMRAIERAPAGSRFLIYCTVKAGNREKAKKLIKVIEKSLILHAQNEGHELFNKSGTKMPTHEIAFTGNRVSEAIAPRLMLIKRALVKTKASKATLGS